MLIYGYTHVNLFVIKNFDAIFISRDVIMKI